MKQAECNGKLDTGLTDLDGLQTELHCGIEAVGAIQELLDGAGNCSVQSYSDALFCAFCYLKDASNKMREVIDGALAAKKAKTA